MNSLFAKPFALSIGPQRCGTRWLEAYLRGRGDVCLPETVKEIFFFDRHFQRGPEFYISHFHPQDRHALVMELTTTAFDSPEAPRYAYNLLGQNIVLLCPLRDPLARAREVYIDHLNYGIVSGSIAEAVEQAPQILLASRYADNIERWLERFGRERLNVVFYEDLERDPSGYAKTVSEALWLPFKEPAPGVRLTPPSSVARPQTFQSLLRNLRPGSSKGGGASPAPMPDMDWLAERLAPEKERLEKLLGMKISAWKP